MARRLGLGSSIARLWATLPLLVSSLASSGCSCGEKSDEELLKERIDTPKVHLYLATKIAVLKADESEEAKVASQALRSALSALDGQPRPDAKPGEPTRELTAADALALAKALYVLEREGRELLHSGDEKGMKPILPKLFSPPEDLANVLDLEMEHALLLTGMFVLKFHPKSPAPVPPELMLYEAWMTHTDKLLPGMRSLVRMEKAVLYGGNELCDLAANEAKGADAEQATAAQLAEVIRIAGAQETPEERELTRGLAAIRALSHGITAQCYQKRGDDDEAVAELDATLNALADSGVEAGRLALLRAYVAQRREEYVKAKEQLVVARDYEGTDEETRKDIETLLSELDDDPNLFEEKLGSAWFNYTLLKIVVRQLDEAGVFDEVKQTPLAKTLTGFATAVTSTPGTTTDAASDGGWLERAKGLLAD